MQRIMKEQGRDKKFEQISNIFSQFSEENKEKLIKTANRSVIYGR